MNEKLVLVDSSAWISYLLNQKESVGRSVEGLLADHRVAINPVIRVELLTGAKNEVQYSRMEDAFEGLHLLEMTDAVWRRAEKVRFQLGKAGQLIPLPDVLIACSALVHHCSVLHVDRHFDRIAHATALKIYR